jgi:hypothetical protein
MWAPRGAQHCLLIVIVLVLDTADFDYDHEHEHEHEGSRTCLLPIEQLS